MYLKEASYFYQPSEYGRPWKLFSLLVGVVLLIAGSIYTPAPDWDIPVSLIMAGCTYLTAPCTIKTLLCRNWKHLPLAAFLTWLSVDGLYSLYWHFKDPSALALMRSANASASLALYGICGILWLYRGKLSDLTAEVLNIITHHEDMETAGHKKNN